tara:strand:+ start:484 stop:1314 length:831 start_codon:yes stop_codon:yes gene_type:complete
MNYAVDPLSKIEPLVANLTFFVDNGEPPINYVTEKGLERGGEYREHTLELIDGRILRYELSLNKEGFEFLEHKTSVMDFYNNDEIEHVYNIEIIDLIKKRTGADDVVVFDHTVRVENEDRRSEKEVREPVLFVHNDYTHESGPQRVRDLLSEDRAKDLLTRRFNIINIWRSIAGPVQTTPLAVCDATTISQGQLITAERRTKDRVGYTQAMTYRSDNKWYYFSDMIRNEALLIKTYESNEDKYGGPSGHSAFKNTSAPSDALPRESIETRVFAFFK